METVGGDAMRRRDPVLTAMAWTTAAVLASAFVMALGVSGARAYEDPYVDLPVDPSDPPVVVAPPPTHATTTVKTPPVNPPVPPPPPAIVVTAPLPPDVPPPTFYGKD